MLKNTDQNYGLVARLFHWLTAVVVVGLFALGLWMVDLTYYSSWYVVAPHTHRSIGLLLALLIIFRIVWRLVNLTPKALSTHKRWEVISAHLVHYVLYLMMSLLFITGYLISTAKGKAVDVFNWFSLPATITSDMLGVENFQDILREIHEILAFMLIGIAIMHGLAALKHHFIDKDATLQRMLGKKKTQT